MFYVPIFASMHATFPALLTLDFIILIIFVAEKNYEAPQYIMEACGSVVG
jgi:hypothetical protein